MVHVYHCLCITNHWFVIRVYMVYCSTAWNLFWIFSKIWVLATSCFAVFVGLIIWLSASSLLVSKFSRVVNNANSVPPLRFGKNSALCHFTSNFSICSLVLDIGPALSLTVSPISSLLHCFQINNVRIECNSNNAKMLGFMTNHLLTMPGYSIW